jgi:hypothetical protein
MRTAFATQGKTKSGPKESIAKPFDCGSVTTDYLRYEQTEDNCLLETVVWLEPGGSRYYAKIRSAL